DDRVLDGGHHAAAAAHSKERAARLACRSIPLAKRRDGKLTDLTRRPTLASSNRQREQLRLYQPSKELDVRQVVLDRASSLGCGEVLVTSARGAFEYFFALR